MKQKTFLVCVWLVAAAAAFGQTSLPAAVVSRRPSVALEPAALETTIRKDVNEVNLFFTASNRRGRFVDDLRLGEVDLRDNRVPPQAVHAFEVRSNLPLRCVLLIDTSDSISTRFAFEKAAAADFLRVVMRSDLDEAKVIGFNSNVHVSQDWTNDIGKLGSALHALRSGGTTAFYDAIVYAAAYLRGQDENTRRAIVVITDGQDNASKSTEADAIHAALAAQVTVYALNTGRTIAYPRQADSTLELAAQHTLSAITHASGGRLLDGNNKKVLRAAFEKVAQELRNQYLIAYTPAEFVADDSFRRVEIRAHRHGIRLRARRGYYSGRQLTSQGAASLTEKMR